MSNGRTLIDAMLKAGFQEHCQGFDEDGHYTVVSYEGRGDETSWFKVSHKFSLQEVFEMLLEELSDNLIKTFPNPYPKNEMRIDMGDGKPSVARGKKSDHKILDEMHGIDHEAWAKQLEDWHKATGVRLINTGTTNPKLLSVLDRRLTGTGHLLLRGAIGHKAIIVLGPDRDILAYKQMFKDLWYEATALPKLGVRQRLRIFFGLDKKPTRAQFDLNAMPIFVKSIEEAKAKGEGNSYPIMFDVSYLKTILK